MSVRILKFRLSNFKSFLDESELSFSDTGSPSRQITAFFGPNASGKSNIASALKIFRVIVKNSTNSGFRLPYFPFAFREDSKKHPTFFLVEFLRNNFIFQFSFSYDSKSIFRETLKVRPLERNQFRTIYDRIENTLNPSAANFGFSSALLGRTRRDSLLVTKAYEDNNKYARAVFDLVHSYRVVSGSDPDLEALAAGIFDVQKEVAKKVTKLFQSNDYAIHSISTSKTSVPDSILATLNLPDDVRMSLRDNGALRLSFNHLLRDADDKIIKNGSGNPVLVSNQPIDESTGTRRLFSVLVPLADTIRRGRALYIDEFGAFLHPEVSRKLIEFFKRESTQTNSALFLNTQDIALMGSLSRDEITIVEKDNLERTHVRRLEDFDGVRKSESFRNAYIHGKYGALPETNIIDNF